jgi:nickel-type superoxide dismutase maturation protease
MSDGTEHYPVLVRFTFIPFFTVKVIGISMEPVLHNGEVWLARSGTGKVSSGRVVVFEHPTRPDLLEVKRAVRALADGWWVEGDNSTHSIDSREYGPIPIAAIQGVLIRRLIG